MAACREPAPPTPSFTWLTPPEWKSETIPFPLEFAPSLPYRGVEEVRFSPHFFDAKADTYFSYSFAWIIEGGPPIAPEQLASDVRTYFFGLMHAVGREKHKTYLESSFSAQVEADGPRYRGVVNIVDAFGDGHAVVLRLDAEASTCSGHRVLLVTLSPRPEGDAVWQSLLEQRRTFHCP
jgi:hypothetical protein